MGRAVRLLAAGALAAAAALIATGGGSAAPAPAALAAVHAAAPAAVHAADPAAVHAADPEGGGSARAAARDGGGPDGDCGADPTASPPMEWERRYPAVGPFGILWNESATRLPLELRRSTCRSLRRFSAARSAVPRLLFVIPANAGHLAMAVSCYCGLLLAGRKETVMMALDFEALSALTERGIPAFPNPAGAAESRELLFKEAGYVMLTCLKFRGIYYLLRWGFQVVFSDADVAFLRDPLPHVIPLMNYSLVLTVDDPIIRHDQPSAHCGDPPPVWKNLGYGCTGIFYARDSRISRFVIEVADGLMLGTALHYRNKLHKVVVHDQLGVNHVLRGVDHVRPHVHHFDRCLFANGNFYWRLKMPQRHGVTPVAVHANYFIGREKQGLLRKLQWFERCDSPGPLDAQLSLVQEARRPFLSVRNYTNWYWLWDLYLSSRHRSRETGRVTIRQWRKDYALDRRREEEARQRKR